MGFGGCPPPPPPPPPPFTSTLYLINMLRIIIYIIITNNTNTHVTLSHLRSKEPSGLHFICSPASRAMTSVCTDQIPAAAESAALSLGYSSLKPEQRDVIVEFVLGSDVFAFLPTGYGKSLSLCLSSPSV